MTGWAQMRPFLVGWLLLTDVFVVAVLAIARPESWWAPFLAFGIILIGLIVMLRWSIAHRHDP